MIKLMDLLLENSEDTIQMYLDIIAMDSANPKYDKYKLELKNKYNVDWKDELNDDFYIENANLKDIKSKDDFRNFQKYVQYAKEIYALRNYSEPSMKSGNKILTFKTIMSVLVPLNLKIEHRAGNGIGNYAQWNGKVQIPDPCDKGTLVHELGHAFDENVYKEDGPSKKLTNATTTYGIGNAGEVFAENFKCYFINPSWLKSNMPEVFMDLDMKIPSLWKSVIKKL